MIFGELPIETKELARRFAAQLRQEFKPPWGRKKWTAQIKEALRSLGTDRGFEVYPDTSSKKTSAEFMLDLVWYYKKEGGFSLAMESEWQSAGDVMDDFEKVMYVKAPLKLLVMQRDGTIRGKVEDYLKGFGQHVQGERYLLMERQREDAPDFLFYEWTAPSNGTVEDVQFQLLALD